MPIIDQTLKHNVSDPLWDSQLGKQILSRGYVKEMVRDLKLSYNPKHEEIIQKLDVVLKNKPVSVREVEIFKIYMENKTRLNSANLILQNTITRLKKTDKVLYRDYIQELLEVFYRNNFLFAYLKKGPVKDENKVSRDKAWYNDRLKMINKFNADRRLKDVI